MSEKAILIIDKPTDCFECPCFDSDATMLKCNVTGLLYEDCNSTTCPLKPVPRLENNEHVYQMMTKHSAMCNVGTSTKFSMLRFIDGWESCLDEIEGK